MEHSFWHNKWQSNQVGFHQENGHPEFVEHFPKLHAGARVLVPLCGKSVDMIWLAKKGYLVVGIELSEIAAIDFFKENGLTAKVSESLLDDEVFTCYQCDQLPITLWIGDFFKFQTGSSEAFDALYDRAALIALPEDMRASYIQHCQELLNEVSHGLIITTVYDQRLASGPPFSVTDEELHSLWGSTLTLCGEVELIDEEPRWQAKGLTSFKERFWSW